MVSGPLIAIPTYHLAPGRVARWPQGGYGVPSPYVDCLRRAGARAVLLTEDGDGDPAELLAQFHGLLLVGGGDVDPARYGAEPGSELYGVEPDRDRLEIDLLLAADRTGMPALAICRGAQVANVAFGGTLLQHLPAIDGLIQHGIPVEDAVATHEVRLAPGSRIAELCGTDVLTCSSHHHQGVDRLGDGLVATGWSPDGLVEAIERDHGRLVAIQWHPEDTAASDPAQQALFDALAAGARGYAAV